MPENVRLKINNFVRYEGYFYHLDNNADTLYQKTDDGNNAFSYPLDNDITNEVICLQHDGTFFYTLENIQTITDGQLLIKKWKIEDFILKLQRTYTLNGITSKKYDSNCFVIEHYHYEFFAAASAGVSSITLTDVNRLTTGDILQLGPSTFVGSEGQSEEVTVLSVGPGNLVNLTTNLTHSYNPNDLASFANKAWFFNRFQPSDPDPILGSGQLYEFLLNPAGNPTPTPRKAGNEFREIFAATFLTDNFYSGDSYVAAGPRNFLTYINGTNLLFIDIDPARPGFPVTVQSAAQDNQETDTTVIPVLDITHENNTIFRLQMKGVYRDSGGSLTDETWSEANYMLATLQRLPASISLTADPAIISADGGASSSTVTAIVRDQFDNAIPSRVVDFSEDDASGTPQGDVNPTSDTTDSNGEATVNYLSGTEAKLVTITAKT